MPKAVGVRVPALALALFAVLLAAPHEVSAQLLGSASSAARGSSDHSSNGSDDDDDDGGSFLGSISSAVRGGGSDGGSSHSYDDDDYDTDEGSYGSSSGYSGYGGWGRATYSDPGPSYGATVGPQGCTADGSVGGAGCVPPDVFAVQLDVEGGYVLAGAGRVGVGARLRIPEVPIDVASRYSVFLEEVDHSVQSIAIGRVGADIRIVEECGFVLRLGAALRHMQDGLGPVFGLDAAASLELTLAEPIVIAMEATAGFIGQAVLLTARGILGVTLGIVTLYAGWDFQTLFNSGNVDLGGPMAGLSFRIE
ncbi:MAG: hypothetical protein AB7S26_03990 [Sandaracinaceae bacterium]